MSIGGANRGSEPLDWAIDIRAINKLKIKRLFFLIYTLARVNPTVRTACPVSPANQGPTLAFPCWARVQPSTVGRSYSGGSASPESYLGADPENEYLYPEP